MTSNDVLSSNPHENVVTKATFRFKVWNLLENKDLVRFPRPCKGRIPNFVNNLSAAEKLSALDVFKKAENIKVNLDKPQEPVRFKVLEAGKTLLVPTYRFTDGLLIKMCPPPDATRQIMRAACKPMRVEEFGKPIKLEEKIHVDMVVLGSVAVSADGRRIGKGEGFSDLEFAVMAAFGVVTQDTVVVTTVHDEQILESLPSELFQPFDIPVDFIITPTKVIEVIPRQPKPLGILWHILSDRRMQQIPLLKTLRDKEMEDGKDCPLKEIDSEPEDRPKPYYRPPFRRRPQTDRQRSQESGTSSPAPRDYRPTRFFRRRPRTKQVDHNGSGDAVTAQHNGINDQRGARAKPERHQNQMNGENKENHPQSRPKPKWKMQRQFSRSRFPVDFSVKVGNIGSTVRVRDLKAALQEKGVRPREIFWKGSRGFALLHFAKMKSQVEEQQPVAVDDVIASLQGLTVKSQKADESEVKETILSVEPAKPISRIEDAGVTSV